MEKNRATWKFKIRRTMAGILSAIMVAGLAVTGGTVSAYAASYDSNTLTGIKQQITDYQGLITQYGTDAGGLTAMVSADSIDSDVLQTSVSTLASEKTVLDSTYNLIAAELADYKLLNTAPNQGYANEDTVYVNGDPIAYDSNTGTEDTFVSVSGISHKYMVYSATGDINNDGVDESFRFYVGLDGLHVLYNGEDTTCDTLAVCIRSAEKMLADAKTNMDSTVNNVTESVTAINDGRHVDSAGNTVSVNVVDNTKAEATMCDVHDTIVDIIGQYNTVKDEYTELLEKISAGTATNADVQTVKDDLTTVISATKTAGTKISNALGTEGIGDSNITTLRQLLKTVSSTTTKLRSAQSNISLISDMQNASDDSSYQSGYLAGFAAGTLSGNSTASDSELATQVTDLTNQVATLKSTNTTLKKQTSTLKSNLSVVKAANVNLANQITVLKTNIATLKSSNSNLANSVSTLKNNVTSLTDSNTNLINQVKTAQNKATSTATSATNQNAAGTSSSIGASSTTGTNATATKKTASVADTTTGTDVSTKQAQCTMMNPLVTDSASGNKTLPASFVKSNTVSENNSTEIVGKNVSANASNNTLSADAAGTQKSGHGKLNILLIIIALILVGGAAGFLIYKKKSAKATDDYDEDDYEDEDGEDGDNNNGNAADDLDGVENAGDDDEYTDDIPVQEDSEPDNKAENMCRTTQDNDGMDDGGLNEDDDEYDGDDNDDGVDPNDPIQ